MRNRIGIAVVVAALLSAALPARLLATGGYFMHGIGTPQKGMAGAGVALLFGPTDAATNPAAGVFSGPGLDFGVAAFSPDRQFEVTGNPSGFPGTFGLRPGTVVSDKKWFPVPHFGLTWKLGEKAAFGLAMYANGGMNTTYNQAVFGGSSPTGVNLSQMFFAPNVSVKLGGGKHAIGGSVLIAYQRFDAKGLEAFSMFSSAPTKLTNNPPDSGYGVGARIGYLGQLSKYLSVGASYQTRVNMSEFDSYSGLFAEQGGFDIPSTWVAGIAIKPTASVDIALDVQGIAYGDVKSIANPLLPNLQTAKLGDDNGAGFGWEDMTTVKMGLQYRGARGIALRGGYSYGANPVPTSEVLFNILAPGIIEQHVTGGMSKTFGNGHRLDIAVTRALSHTVSGPNSLEAPNQQRISLTMRQWDFEVGYLIKLGK